MSPTSPWTTTRTVAGDGLDLAVYEANTAADDTVVLVHGYPDTHAVWDGVATALAARFHVVAYDVRGAGASGAPTDREGYDLDHLVADLGAVLDATSPDRAVHLVAHDWGSIQAWEAVTCGRLDGRIASYTSMSGPSLDHVAQWMQARRTLRPRALRELLGQGVHSWYVAFFQSPRLPELAWRTVAGRSFPRYLTRVEGIPPERLPGPTLAADGARGVELYRRNVPRRMADPQTRTTDIPVQVVVPTGDRFVTPALLDDVGIHAPNLRRRAVVGGHWNNVSHPDRFAGWVTEFVDDVQAGRPMVGGPDVVVVTGAGGGIGRETALAFAERGAHVVVADIAADAAERTAELCRLAGGDGTAFVVDVSDAGAMESFAKQVLTDLGPPDVVVANAGIGMAGGILDTAVADWERILGVNLWGVIHTHRLFAPAMVDRGEGGQLVTIASAAAYTPLRTTGAYSTTKAAAMMLSECLRAELAGDGIGVSVICPGFVDTGIATATHYVGVDDDEQARRRAAADKAYRRRGFTPDRVARAVVHAVDTDAAVVPVAAEARVTRFLSRFLPGVLRRIARIDLTPR